MGPSRAGRGAGVRPGAGQGPRKKGQRAALTSWPTPPQPAVGVPEAPGRGRHARQEEEKAAPGAGETQDQLASAEGQVRLPRRRGSPMRGAGAARRCSPGSPPPSAPGRPPLRARSPLPSSPHGTLGQVQREARSQGALVGGAGGAGGRALEPRRRPVSPSTARRCQGFAWISPRLWSLQVCVYW